MIEIDRMIKKDFDCIEQKRKAQKAILADTKGLKPEEEIAYFRKTLSHWQGLLAREQSTKFADKHSQIK